MQETQKSFLKKYNGNKTAEEFVCYQRYEAELYYKYKAILRLCILYRKEDLEYDDRS